MQEEGDVSRGFVEGRHADDKANETHADGADDVAELLLLAIGVPGVDEREDTGENPGRGAHEESGDVAQAKSAGECRLLSSVSDELMHGHRI